MRDIFSKEPTKWFSLEVVFTVQRLPDETAAIQQIDFTLNNKYEFVLIYISLDHIFPHNFRNGGCVTFFVKSVRRVFRLLSCYC